MKAAYEELAVEAGAKLANAVILADQFVGPWFSPTRWPSCAFEEFWLAVRGKTCYANRVRGLTLKSEKRWNSSYFKVTATTSDLKRKVNLKSLKAPFPTFTCLENKPDPAI